MSFITKVAVDCGQEYFEEHLKGELEKMGYEVRITGKIARSDLPVIVNWNGCFSVHDVIPYGRNDWHEENGFIRIHRDFPRKGELFLALAGMREAHEPFALGEIVYRMESKLFASVIRVDNLNGIYGIQFDDKSTGEKKLFNVNTRRATVEEILSYFNYKESDWFDQPEASALSPDEKDTLLKGEWELGDKIDAEIGSEIYAWNKGDVARDKVKYIATLGSGRVIACDKLDLNTGAKNRVTIFDHACPLNHPVTITYDEIKKMYAELYGVPQELIQIVEEL